MSVPTTEVTIWCHTGPRPLRVATAWFSQRREQVTTALTYDPAWQSARHGHAISPDLPLTVARHHLPRLPGALADCSPDRWGRMLIDKRARAVAHEAGTRATSASAVDYLLGVTDLTRQGALRFTTGDNGPFLAADPGVPALIELPRLLRAADLAASDDDSAAAVKALLEAGSGSLGGARPKASVRDGDNLAIAKFPHHSDQWDVMAWEKTALDLAARAGIRVPTSRLVPVDARHALVLNRFDRLGSTRAAYISALTLVGGVDGGSYDYLEVAEALAEHGSAVAADLDELWRRIAFGLLIHNSDDHLRNHGLLRHGAGWRLSPAFDVNPNPDLAAGSATTIAFTSGDRHASLEGLLASAADFGLTGARARQVFTEVADAVATWRQVARSHAIRASELDRFADTFDALLTPRMQS